MCVTATQCYVAGRIEDAVHHAEVALEVLADARQSVPFGCGGWVNAAYITTGQPTGAVEFCREYIASGYDAHTLTRSCLVQALTIAGLTDEAATAAVGLIDAAEATANPCALSLALLAYGFAYSDTDPAPALQAMQRGLVIAQDTGNSLMGAHLAGVLCRVESNHGDPVAALDYFRMAINQIARGGQHHHDQHTSGCLGGLIRPAWTLRVGRHDHRFRVPSRHCSDFP